MATIKGELLDLIKELNNLGVTPLIVEVVSQDPEPGIRAFARSRWGVDVATLDAYEEGVFQYTEERGSGTARRSLLAFSPPHRAHTFRFGSGPSGGPTSETLSNGAFRRDRIGTAPFILSLPTAPPPGIARSATGWQEREHQLSYLKKCLENTLKQPCTFLWLDQTVLVAKGDGKNGVENAKSAIFLVLQNHTLDTDETKDDAYQRAAVALHRITSTFYVHELGRAFHRSAIAAIMARNMSHNIGSHVLASPELLKYAFASKAVTGSTSSAEDILNSGISEIQKLHNFLQQRMDFIAQVVTYTPSWGEPMLLIGDVLDGLLDQRLLMNFLIRDLRPEGSQIWFYVHLKGDQVWKRSADTKDWQWAGTGDRQTTVPDDLLVSIPGGSIGCHALYDIVENIMRNSAKYGEKGQSDYHFHIKVCEKDNPSRYLLSIWDNLSVQDKTDRIQKVQGNLVKELIEVGTGDISGEGKGLHEIKECARILGYPYNMPDSPETSPAWNFEVRTKDGAPVNLPVAVTNHQDADLAYLAYEFFLQKPRLVSILCSPSNKMRFTGRIPSANAEVKPANNASDAERAGLFLQKGTVPYCLEALVSHPSQIAIMWFPDAALHELLTEIASRHFLLPYRLLLVTSKSLDEIHHLVAAHDINIPQRRLLTCTEAEIAAILRDRNGDWPGMVLTIYELWLRKFKPLEERDPKWHLTIGFERGSHQVFDIWPKALAGFKSDLCDIHVIQVESTNKYNLVFSTAVGTAVDLLDKLYASKRCCVIDNHGKLRSAMDLISTENLYSHHDIDSKHSFRLFQTLESPPTSRFAFHMLLLGLVESLITDVLLIDERIAEATMNTEQKLDARYKLLQRLTRTRGFPIYSLWFSKDHRVFSSELIDKVQETLGEHNGLSATEGVHLYRENEFSAAHYRSQKADGSAPQPKTSADIVIIHQGIIDLLQNSGYWDQDKHFRALTTIAPWVVVTSGRGRNIRHVPPECPFLEFSIIRDSTYSDLSKYTLMRAIGSVTGSR